MVAQFGPYLIDELLAEGGMARVFRARLRGLGGFEKTLVLKQIRPELAKDPRFVEMFVREANTLVQMSHPHIVPVYELGAVDGSYYLSMEYIEGATLSRLLEDGPLGPALVAQLGVQLCDALDYAHGRFGILHRDITPRNLIVDDAGHVRLLDFGIAGALEVRGAERFGSPGYMSPEQVRGEMLKPTSDLFSIGAVLFEALTGKPAFEQVVRGTLGPAPKLTPSAQSPAPLANLINALLETDPALRPAAALEVGRTLRSWLAHTQPEGAFAELRERARRVRKRTEEAQTTTSSTPATALESATQPLGEPGQSGRAKTFATSPILTEMLRSAAGVGAPIPVANAPAKEPTTRRIEADEARESAAHPRATALMLRYWPALALAAFAVAAAVMLGAPRAERDARKDVRERAQPASPIESQGARVPEGPHSSELPSETALKPEPVQPNAAAPEEVSVGSGFLTLTALPWAAVTLDGKRLGITPLRRIKTRAGAHALKFECPPLGRTKRVTLTLQRDAHARLMIDLNENPPLATLDGAAQLR